MMKYRKFNMGFLEGIQIKSNKPIGDLTRVLPTDDKR